MDILKAEIERKKRLLLSHSAVDTEKKRFKRGDIESAPSRLHEDLVKEKELKDGADEEKPDELNSSINYSAESLIKSKSEIIRKLRERGEPIRLFGESDSDVVRRLRKIEFMAPEDNKGLRNDFKAAMDKIDQEYLDDLIKQQTDSGNKTEKINAKVLNMTLEDLKDQATGFNTGDTNKDREVILSFITFLLDYWNMKLTQRTEADRMSTQGKLQSAIYKQTKTYMKPLIKKLKKKNLEDTMLRALTEIVVHMLDREYVKANDMYVQMAIGNAAWPIGVTMVGIHARTGREKIFAQHVAHVLNDETQRKYIQGFKRLMTRCQTYFWTVPSKSVEFQGYE